MSSFSQVNNDQYRDLFLVGEFGEVCTMCEVIVLCEETQTVPSYPGIPENHEFVLYHLKTRTFWSQISTIWEWFSANFSSASLAQGHDRPVWKYTVTLDSWTGPQIVNAWIALEPPLLTFADTAVDRSNQAWLNVANGTSIGYCQRLPLWESLETITQHSNTEKQP
jgi:hypothetical protein